MKGSLILLRGLPGSGKSKLAEVLSENGLYPIFSVDDFFTDEKTGIYEFNFNENHLAYKSCIEKVESSMSSGAKKIFVHNTFTMEWEMEPYFSLCEKHSYFIHVCTVEHRHKGINQHGVTDEQLKKMAEKFRVVLM
jgi:predicted kinase